MEHLDVSAQRLHEYECGAGPVEALVFLERHESHRCVEIACLGVAGVLVRRPDSVNGEELCTGGDEVGCGASDESLPNSRPSVCSMNGE